MTTRMSRSLLAVIVLTAGPSVASAQADLSGVWIRQPAGNAFSETPPPPMTPWALEKFQSHKPTVGPQAALDANDPTLDCAAPGVPYILAVPTPFEFVHTPGHVIQLFEYNHFVRRIHTDGRPHPANLRDTGSYEWMGHSIGQWEGDTFVIDTIGFNEETWLDRLGHPHSDALHVVERIRRPDHDTLEYRSHGRRSKGVRGTLDWPNGIQAEVGLGDPRTQLHDKRRHVLGLQAEGVGARESEPYAMSIASP